MKSNVTLKVAESRELTVLEVVPVDISIRNRPGNSSKQLLHVLSELKSLFVSKSCLVVLGLISENFPMPPSCQENLKVFESGDQDRASCGCFSRGKTPKPPDLPCEHVEKNIPRLKDFIVIHYAASTMNMCTHQLLPVMTGPPLHFTLKPDAQLVAVYTHQQLFQYIGWIRSESN